MRSIPTGAAYTLLTTRARAQNDHTNEGWRRDGWWERTDEKWEKGLCWPRYNRTCSTLWREKDLRTSRKHPVENTDLAFGTKCVGLLLPVRGVKLH